LSRCNFGGAWPTNQPIRIPHDGRGWLNLNAMMEPVPLKQRPIVMTLAVATTGQDTVSAATAANQGHKLRMLVADVCASSWPKP